MTTSQQAKNGLKTFLLTFAISVFVFGFTYYFISDLSTGNVSIDNQDNLLGNTVVMEKVSAETPEVQGISTETDSEPNADASSAFADLSEQKMNVDSKVVLATGATSQTTQSTTPVPDTGNMSVTFGIISSIMLFSFFAYLLVVNPRKYALEKFEREALRDL